MIFTQQSAAYEAVYESGVTGLVGIVSVMIVDNDGNTVTAPSTAGITETLAGSGVYVAERIAPGDTGQYTVIWTLDGTYDDGTVTIEDLIVAASEGAEPLAPLPPPGQVGAIPIGPCSAWTTDDAVAACCSASVGSDTSVFDDFIQEASGLLWNFSGGLYSGSCQITARPCSNQNFCGMQVLSRGHVVWSGSGWAHNGVSSCGCIPDRQVLLSGYPVRSIVEVLIDGAAVDPDTYELRDRRRLVRMGGYTWPSCQDMHAAITEEGTFAVTYLYGIDPPLEGQMAAAELACELYKKCNGGDCALPAGTTRVVRQGVVIERLAFSAWGLQDGIWRTGLERVDAFLNSVNPKRRTRRPAVWSPDGPKYARPVS